MARDVVRFGPGVALADLALRIAVPAASADAYPEQPWHDGGTLSVRWGAGGFDVAVPDLNYGFSGASLPAEPDGYRLGEGIEAFEFDDGGSYTLEQVLAQASVLPLPANTTSGATRACTSSRRTMKRSCSTTSSAPTRCRSRATAPTSC